MRLFFFDGLRFLGVVFALAVAGGVAWGDDAGECARLAEAGEYGAAFVVCERAAVGGDARAQYNLGWMYDKGEGVAVDKEEAVRWYRLAAEQGNARAQYNLGWMYANGEGVVVDKVAAVRWYRLAAAQGVAEAQFNLGVMYVLGEGVIVDKSEAFIWFSLAAITGDADAVKGRDIVEGELSAGEVRAARLEARRRLEAIRGR